jgi:hypothetical protein
MKLFVYIKGLYVGAMNKEFNSIKAQTVYIIKFHTKFVVSS